MANYELVPVPVPNSQAEAERIEQWLEQCSQHGAVLVCFMPTQNTDRVLAVLTVKERGQVPPPGRWRRF